MKFEDLLRITSLLIVTSLMSGCGASGSNNPPNLFNGAVFISDRAGPDELYIADSEAVAVKISGATLAGNVTSFLVSPNAGFIAYLADQDNAGTNELYFLKNNGNTPQSTDAPIKINPDITLPSQSITEYQWSPNGLFMAYLSDQEFDGVQHLYISDARTVIKVSPAGIAGDVTEIKWSPDSKSIAFKAPVAGKDELHVSKTDGSVIATQVTDSAIGAGPTDFEWSPDSSLIAYLSDQDSVGVIDLYTTADNVLASTKVTDVTTGSVQAFRWPNINSTLLAYSASPSVADDMNLYVTEPTNNTAVVVVSAVTLGGGVTDNFLWAPNNSLLAYVADQDTVGVFELYTTLVDGVVKGTKRSKLNVGTGAGVTTTDGFIWGAFSNQLIYRAEDTLGVFELFTSTTDGVGATEGLQISKDLIGGSVEPDFKLSPFGNAVTYIADEDGTGVFELYVTGLTVDAKDSAIKVSATLDTAREVFQHDWSSDGTKVVYVADQDTDGVNDIYTNNTSATDNINLSTSPAVSGIIQGALIDSLGVTDDLLPL